jgi:hypothetical protein
MQKKVYKEQFKPAFPCIFFLHLLFWLYIQTDGFIKRLAPGIIPADGRKQSFENASARAQTQTIIIEPGG